VNSTERHSADYLLHSRVLWN